MFLNPTFIKLVDFARQHMLSLELAAEKCQECLRTNTLLQCKNIALLLQNQSIQGTHTMTKLHPLACVSTLPILNNIRFPFSYLWCIITFKTWKISCCCSYLLNEHKMHTKNFSVRPTNLNGKLCTFLNPKTFSVLARKFKFLALQINLLLLIVCPLFSAKIQSYYQIIVKVLDGNRPSNFLARKFKLKLCK